MWDFLSGRGSRDNIHRMSRAESSQSVESSGQSGAHVGRAMSVPRELRNLIKKVFVC